MNIRPSTVLGLLIFQSYLFEISTFNGAEVTSPGQRNKSDVEKKFQKFKVVRTVPLDLF